MDIVLAPSNESWTNRTVLTARISGSQVVHSVLLDFTKTSHAKAGKIALLLHYAEIIKPDVRGSTVDNALEGQFVLARRKRARGYVEGHGVACAPAASDEVVPRQD